MAKKRETFEVVDGKVEVLSDDAVAPASTLEARENQLINLAVNLAEKQLSDGTASSAGICHYLKLATKTERIKAKLMEEQTALFTAKVESLETAKNTELMYKDAIAAMKAYG